MLRRPVVTAVLILFWVLMNPKGGWPQRSNPVSLPAAASAPSLGLQPEAIAARRTALQAELEALGKSGLQAEELDKARAPFEQMLKMLAALEDAHQKRAAYQAQLEALPRRLKELDTQSTTLAGRPATRFDEVTEQLRDQYEAELTAVQTEIKALHAQTSTGETRLVDIAKKLEQFVADRAQLEKALATARSSTSLPVGKSPPAVSEIERLNLKQHLLQVESEALKAERLWLTKRGPLQDALQRVAKLRLEGLQRDLKAIKQRLGSAIEREQESLGHTVSTIQQQLERASDPIDTLRLTVQLETAHMRAATTDYRQQLNQLSNRLQALGKRSAQEKQDVDRLTSLVEKYTKGEVIAQSLSVAFERLRRERTRYRDTSLKQTEEQLRAVTTQMFALDDRLYEFDRQAEARLAELQEALKKTASPPAASHIATVRKAFDEQKAALRDQQQVLATLVQDQTRLLTLHRERKRMLDSSYLFILTQMFWVRDGRRVNLEVGRDIVSGALANVKRWQRLVHTELRHFRTKLTVGPQVWLLAAFFFLFLPWVAVRSSRGLRQRVARSLAACAQRELPPGLHDAFLLALRAAVWPAHLLLFMWIWPRFLLNMTDPLEIALVRSLAPVALILWVGLLGHDILRRDGWGRQYWGHSQQLCRFLHHLLVIGCVAALLLLVPRHILLTAPGEADTMVGSFALARFCLLAFQTVTLVLVAIAGWRSGPLMETVLARSREHEGLLWRVWPFIYLALLAGIAAIIVLDILGYRYAAQFVWLRTLESFSVLLARRLLVALLILRLAHSVVEYVVRIGHRRQQREAVEQVTIDRYFRIAYAICNVLLLLVSIGAVLEIWGVSITWLLTSPMGTDILKRILLIAVTIGVSVIIVQLSKTFADYLLRPKTTQLGTTQEASSKLKTMAPLIQTLVKVGIFFAAALVILEQLNVATAPSR
jgi:hypothetical protein